MEASLCIPHSAGGIQRVWERIRGNTEIIRLYETRVANSRNDNVGLGHLLRELAVPLEMRTEAVRDNDQRRSWYQQRANQRQKMEDQEQENR